MLFTMNSPKVLTTAYTEVTIAADAHADNIWVGQYSGHLISMMMLNASAAPVKRLTSRHVDNFSLPFYPSPFASLSQATFAISLPAAILKSAVAITSYRLYACHTVSVIAIIITARRTYYSSCMCRFLLV